jgi:hypothetical protein
MVDVKDIYWLAGMLEGEASFYTYRKFNKNSITSYPELTFQSNDYDIVLRVALILDSSVSRVYARDSNRTTAHKTRICSTKCIQWLMTIYTIMGERRQSKIREVINEWKLSIDGRGTTSDSNWKRNKRIKDIYKRLDKQPSKPVINPFENKIQ